MRGGIRYESTNLRTLEFAGWCVGAACLLQLHRLLFKKQIDVIFV
jgi:hypothetical protein